LTSFATLAAEFGADPDSEGAKEKWFEAADGLKWVRAIRTYIDTHPRSVQNSARLLEDLEEYEAVLTKPIAFARCPNRSFVGSVSAHLAWQSGLCVDVHFRILLEVTIRMLSAMYVIHWLGWVGLAIRWVIVASVVVVAAASIAHILRTRHGR
jgi:hypothetical protein